ncbi:ABC transporter permease [Luteolibacter pohnpeiensis]|uniref:ABC transporter permease n=1 Tax=Luteolibacter pohnpeiensis TaxID=454153 RepID=A0A934VR29_9BACT|nr:ABC transporter permease [Luteolibacter pohnpeiensis]MBK1882741.1 ABC transporter permease [Luteolibacter pohnpeiensis]
MKPQRKSEFLASAPSFLWLAMFVLVPVLIIFGIAFRPALAGGGIGSGWSLEAIRALADPSYPILLVRTLWVSFITTFACILVALPVAYAMARLTPIWRSRALLLVIVPFWTNFVIRVFAWQQILHAEGYLAQMLRAIGLLGENDRLLGTQAAVVMVSIYTYLPFAILPLFAAAEKFDFGLLDAARDLGSKPLGAFVQVFIPGVRQGIITAVLVVFIPMLGSYVIPDMVGGADSQMIGNKIAQRNFNDRNLPEAAALSGALALLVLAPMFLKRKGAEA